MVDVIVTLDVAVALDVPVGLGGGTVALDVAVALGGTVAVEVAVPRGVKVGVGGTASLGRTVRVDAIVALEVAVALGGTVALDVVVALDAGVAVGGVLAVAVTVEAGAVAVAAGNAVSVGVAAVLSVRAGESVAVGVDRGSVAARVAVGVPAPRRSLPPPQLLATTSINTATPRAIVLLIVPPNPSSLSRWNNYRQPSVKVAPRPPPKRQQAAALQSGRAARGPGCWAGCGTRAMCGLRIGGVMRLRQVAFAARDLDAVVGDLCAVLGIEVSFNDPSVAVFGLRNAVMPVGDTFLEVVSPQQAETAAGRYMARRGGDCGYMVMVQSDDSDLDRRRAAQLGVREAWRIDLEDIRGTHLHPRDLGGALLSLDAAVPPTSWRWAGPDWPRRVRTAITRELVGVEMQCAERDAVAERWAKLLDHSPRQTSNGVIAIPLERGALRFVAGPPGADGVTAIDVAVADHARVRATARARGLLRGDDIVICGTRIGLISPPP